MHPQDFLKLYEALEEEDQLPSFPHKGRRTKKPARPAPPGLGLADQDDTRAGFSFTYKAARFEEGWLLESLGGFYEQGWVADVLRKVKGGKEASVYLCRSGPAVGARLLAVKVYRPRSLRNLKNDGLYRAGRASLDEEGHLIRDERMERAMRKGTEYGRELRHQSWIAHEFTALERLHAAGADVPEPYALGHNAIAMDYRGDMDGCAPALNEVSLEPGEAGLLFERLLANVDRMLAEDVIHGDLSAYNILYWEGEITLIDFPQVVHPDVNPMAYRIFERDLRRTCEYFISQGVACDPDRLAADLWTAHGRRLRQQVHPRHLDPDLAEDRRLWQRQQEDGKAA
jgi:RIO kinase 1